MMRTRTKSSAASSGLPLPTKNTTADGSGGVGGGDGGGSGDGNWEMSPGGMLVQSRSDFDQNRLPPPTIRVRVKYGSVYHGIISSQATFGELKKMLTWTTGLHHEDQKLFFKDKERDSKAFLDTTCVKKNSKIVLINDLISQEKSYLEMRKAAKLEVEVEEDVAMEVVVKERRRIRGRGDRRLRKIFFLIGLTNE